MANLHVRTFCKEPELGAYEIFEKVIDVQNAYKDYSVWVRNYEMGVL